MSLLKAIGFFVAISLIVSCGTPAENGNNKMRSQDFFDEGMKLTSDRISLSDHDSIGKSELNKRAIEKFEAALNQILLTVKQYFSHLNVQCLQKITKNV
jgi:hypothetical protein